MINKLNKKDRIKIEQENKLSWGLHEYDYYDLEEVKEKAKDNQQLHYLREAVVLFLERFYEEY